MPLFARLLLCFTLLFGIAAHAQMTTLGVGSSGTAAAAYTGPGDVVSFSAWHGLRAYSKATIGTKLVRIVRASDSTQQDFASAADGSLDAASIATILNATSGKVVTLYDQVGTNHLTQGTDSARPAITANALNSSYGITFNAAASTELVS